MVMRPVFARHGNYAANIQLSFISNNFFTSSASFFHYPDEISGLRRSSGLTKEPKRAAIMYYLRKITNFAS